MSSSEPLNERIGYQQDVVDWSAFFIVLSTVVVTARFASRWLSRAERVKVKWIAWDDSLVVMGFLCFLVPAITWITSAKTAIAGYMVDSSSLAGHELAVSYAKSAWTGSLFYGLACMFPKLSICALYLRIFIHRSTRIATWCVVVFLTANGISFFIAQIFYCVPPSFYWNSNYLGDTARTSLKASKCLNNQAVSIAINPPHIVSDIVMMILPMHTIWHLQAGRAKKIGLTITFLLAGIGLIGCIARWISYLTNVNNTSVRVSSIQSILTLLEPSMYLTAACLPPTRSLFARMNHVIKSTSAYTTITSWASSKVPTRRKSSAADVAPQLPVVLQHVSIDRERLVPNKKTEGPYAGEAHTVAYAEAGCEVHKQVMNDLGRRPDEEEAVEGRNYEEWPLPPHQPSTNA